MNGEAPEEALKLGWAHGALVTTFPGDTTMAKVEQVRAFAKGRLGADSTVAGKSRSRVGRVGRVTMSKERDNV